jgi:hypothetical protein
LVLLTNDSPPVILLGLKLQELYGIDVLLFSCRYSKITAQQPVGSSRRVFKGDTAFNRAPASRSY